MAGLQGITPERRLYLKRVALEIAGHLPDEETEAMRVLRYVGEIVTGFLRPGRSGPTAIRGERIVNSEFRPGQDREH